MQSKALPVTRPVAPHRPVEACRGHSSDPFWPAQTRRPRIWGLCRPWAVRPEPQGRSSAEGLCAGQDAADYRLLADGMLGADFSGALWCCWAPKGGMLACCEAAVF